jgi:hypothetical protein
MLSRRFRHLFVGGGPNMRGERSIAVTPRRSFKSVQQLAK